MYRSKKRRPDHQLARVPRVRAVPEDRMQQSGVLIYKSVTDLNVTIVQPGDDDFMGRTAFAMSNIASVRFAHAKNHSHFFSTPKDDFRGNNLVSSISLIKISLEGGNQHAGLANSFLRIIAYRIFSNNSSTKKKKTVGKVFCPCKTNGKGI